MNRDAMLQALEDEEGEWDFIIVGGGATGLGAAVEAAARGFKTLLLEQSDFAKGTSSRSTKLVHGGVRYLKQGNLSLVLEALRERGLLIENAPHLVHRLPLVVPCYRRWDKLFYGLGLKAYDLLALRHRFGRSRMLSKKRTLELLPTVEPEGLVGGVHYYDGQFDDARMAITLAQTAAGRGAVALNYMPVVGLLKNGGRIVGVRTRDVESGGEYEPRGKVIVNATGVFADQVRRLDDAEAKPMIAPSQGTHLVLDRAFLPGDTALMVPKTDDGRVLFAIPWLGAVVVGTTDLGVPEASLEPRPMAEEIDFLLRHAARYLAKAPRREDVQSVFAGLRPLVSNGDGAGKTASLSRDHTILVAPSGLLTITGGKWTTYRAMGQDVVDRGAKLAGLDGPASPTEHLRPHGYDPQAERHGTLSRYGADAPALEQLMRDEPRLAEPLHRRRPLRGVEVVWAAREEMARTVEDVLARRTRELLLDARASVETAPEVAALLARELGRDEAWRDEQTHQYEALARGYMLPK